MKIVIRVDLSIDGNRSSLSGQFTARNVEDIPDIAYGWIRSIKSDTGYRKTEILKVIYDGDKDITDKVKEIDSAPIPKMDDVFW